jgi:hypothetical protein
MYVCDKLSNYSAINEMSIAKTTTGTRSKTVIDFKYEAN